MPSLGTATPSEEDLGGVQAQPSVGVSGSKVNEAPRCMNELKGGLWSDLTHPYTQGPGDKVQDRQGSRMQVTSPIFGLWVW